MQAKLLQHRSDEGVKRSNAFFVLNLHERVRVGFSKRSQEVGILSDILFETRAACSSGGQSQRPWVVE